jgi:hypothetical protein
MFSGQINRLDSLGFVKYFTDKSIISKFGNRIYKYANKSLTTLSHRPFGKPLVQQLEGLGIMVECGEFDGPFWRFNN